MNLTKGRDGWKATTNIDLPDVIAHGGRDGGREGKSVLTISTSKSRDGISTTASVGWCGDGFMTHAMGLGTGCGDYYRTILKSGARCTEKAVKTMHEEALQQQDALIAEATAFYQSQVRV